MTDDVDLSHIHPGLRHLAVPVSQLRPLPKNPRRGSVDAAVEILREYGQLFPFAVEPEEGGTMTVMAGNHRLEAARRLGWTHVAVLDAIKERADQQDGDSDPLDDELLHEKAVMFALVDNRIPHLGGFDQADLADLLADVVYAIPDTPLMEVVGWDDFSVASIVTNVPVEMEGVGRGRSGGWVAPVLVKPSEAPAAADVPSAAPEDHGAVVMPDRTPPSRTPTGVLAPEGTDEKAAVLGGAAALGRSDDQRGRQATYQYTLVFDGQGQVDRWWAFVRWLRSDPGTAGETIGQKLMDFLEARADF